MGLLNPDHWEIFSMQSQLVIRFFSLGISPRSIFIAVSRLAKFTLPQAWHVKINLAHFITNMDGDSEDDASFLRSARPILDQDHDDDLSWSSIYSHHGSRYACCKTFTTRNEQGVTVMGYIQRTLNAQDIPWVMAWLQGELTGMVVGVSLTQLNGGIFPMHYIISRDLDENPQGKST